LHAIFDIAASSPDKQYMSKSLAKMATFLAAFAVAPAMACHPTGPSLGDDLGEYDRVFVGEVTGARLIGRENELLGRPDACTLPESGEKELCFNFMGASRPVHLFVVPNRFLKGHVKGPIELDEIGCSSQTPKLGGRALFFVRRGSNSASVIWESSSEYFTSWLKLLGATDGR
jgi:hypothetical protein